MTAPASTPNPAPPRGTSEKTPASRWAEIWSTSQLILSLIVASCVLIYLLIVPISSPTTDDANSRPPEVVQFAGPGLLRIKPGTTLDKKLERVTVKATTLNSPILTVTGTVAASLRPGNDKGVNSWQFNSSEVLTAYNDWQKAIADIAFYEKQLASTKRLAESRIEAQKKVVERLTTLVKVGTDTPKDLAAEQSNYLQYQIQGQKDIHEAESAVRIARRSEATLARQLQQAGLAPEMLSSATADEDIVMADVPEGLAASVKVGQGCQAKFFGLPAQVFQGRVESIATVLSKERRSLRVLFVIHDPKDQLRPGMFAEIGLGTDAREALLAPAEGIVHVGMTDYVLVGGAEPDLWRITEIQVGEPNRGQVEILGGVRDGDRVLGKGAILLKPVMLRSLQMSASEAKGGGEK